MGVSLRGLAAAVPAVLALALVLSPVAEAGTLDRIKETGTIRIGYREAEPPMSFNDNDGQPVGYTIDLCQRIVTGVKAAIGGGDVKIEYVPVTAETRFKAVVDNTIDILCGSTTMTLGRRELVDFTQLTFVTGASLMSRKDNPVGGLADLQGKKIGVVKGTTTIEVLTKALNEAMTDAEVVPLETAADGLNALREGTVDAYAADQVVLIGLLLTTEDRDNFAISTELFSFEPFALAVRRNDADFRLVADTVLSQLYRSGTIEEIYLRWFGAFGGAMPSALAAMYRLGATPE